MKTKLVAIISILLILGCKYPVQAKTYIINTHSDADGSISIAPKKATYTSGEKVTITAIPSSGYIFASWGGDATGSMNPLAISVKQDMTISVSFSVAPAEQNTLRIGSFNIQIFGPAKASRTNTLTILANIASSFDVLAIEEVGNNGSSAADSTCVSVMDTYVSKINEIVGADMYSYVRGNQYAIVYRQNEFSSVASSLYSGTASFTYTPLTAYFKSASGNFDFSMLVIHTSPSVADREIPALKTAMAEVSALYSEPDVICLGDFNADGSYYAEREGADLSGYESPSFITVIPNSADTTVAASSNTYDRIELSSSMASDYTSSWGVIHIGQVYDVSRCEGTATNAGTESALSDHYPVWGEFSANNDFD